MTTEDALRSCLYSFAEEDRKGNEANVVDGLFAIARSLESVAYQLKCLGNADAATPMGAIEAFGAHIGEAMDRLSDAVGSLAEPRVDTERP